MKRIMKAKIVNGLAAPCESRLPDGRLSTQTRVPLFPGDDGTVNYLLI